MHQLDIFADSVSVQRANELIAALNCDNHIASRLALRRLEAADPQHAGLPRYQMLCEFGDYWNDTFNKTNGLPAPAAISAAEYLIRERVIPAATIMGNAGADLLRKYWNALAKASEKISIDPENCEYFAAEFYLRAQQFSDVVRTAKGIPGAEMRADVQRWLGLGYSGCGDRNQTRRAVLRYAWLAPERFSDFVEEMRDADLALDWNRFQADLDELDATWFPAWCVYEKKAGPIALGELPAVDGAMAYSLLNGLALRERGRLDSAMYEERARLKQLNESFFAFYMIPRSGVLTHKRS